MMLINSYIYEDDYSLMTFFRLFLVNTLIEHKKNKDEYLKTTLLN